MAVQDMLVGTTELRIKPRRPATVAVLTVITLGVYAIVWYYKVNREMRDFGAIRGEPELAASRPRRSVIAITVGSLIVIPELISFVRTVGRVRTVERLAAGRARGTVGVTCVVVAAVLLRLGGSVHRFGGLFSLAGLAALAGVTYLVQARLNEAWRAIGMIPESPHDTSGSESA